MLANRPAIPLDAVERSALAALDWEETACLLCGRDEADLRAESADHFPTAGAGLRFAIVQCRRCGLVYTNPRPTPETIARFYPESYRPHAPRERRTLKLPSRFWSRVLGRPCPERRGRMPWTGAGRLLDFGCGGGSYLRRMSELGWRVDGIDASPRVVRSVRDQLGLDIRLGSLPHRDLQPESFDVITMWQSLEHVHRPMTVLREALKLLSPNGKLIVATPNYDSLAAEWFGEHWFGLDLPRHLTHFTRKTLAAMLQAAGFRVERVRGLVHYHWLQTSAERALASGAAGFWGRLLSRRFMARMAAWGIYALGRADCIVAVAERPA